MLFFEVALERISTIEELRALIDFAIGIWLVAAPSFKLVMLGVLVALPIVFAAKGFVTSTVGATVRSRVPFLMFSNCGISFVRLQEDWR